MIKNKLKMSVMLLILLTGCVSAINIKNADRYYNTALQAEINGDFEKSKEMYYRSFVNARSANTSKAYISATLYGYGRMLGYTCNYHEAVDVLKESLILENEVSGPVSANISKRLSELARLNMVLELYSEAVGYFEKAEPMLLDMGLLESDPIGYSHYIKDYAKSLKKTGLIEKANLMLNKATTIEKNNSHKKIKYVPVSYESACSERKKS